MSLKEIQRDLRTQFQSDILLRASPMASFLLHDQIISEWSRIRKNNQPEKVNDDAEFHARTEKFISSIDKLFHEISNGSSHEKSPDDRSIEASCPLWKRLQKLCGETSDSSHHINRETPVLFPGPMACTLSRREFPTLFGDAQGKSADTIEYLVTEKSDGIRAILYAKYEPNFFAWKVRDSTGGISLTDTLSLTKAKIQLDQLSLETTLIPLELSHRLQGSLGISMEKVDAFTFCLGGSQEGTGKNLNDDYKLVIFRKGDDFTERESNCGVEKSLFASIPMEFLSACGREFIYLIDRSCDAFYLLNEFSRNNQRTIELPGVSPSVQEFLCDGEIYWNLDPPTDDHPALSYSAFDLFGISCRREAQASQREQVECPLKCLDKVRLGPQILSGHTLSVGQDSSTCLRCRAFVLAQLLPQSVPARGSLIALLHKKYHPLGAVENLFAKISQHGAKYIFNNQNYNDGLIFTPVSQAHFRLRPGRSPLLLKWKWSEKQSIDWLMASDTSIHNDSLTGTAAKLYFHVKHKIGGGGIVLEGHALFREKSAVAIEESPHGLKDDSVCELQLKPSRLATCPSQWVKVGDRPDKREGNSLQTIRNVLEAITENISATELSSLCLGNAPQQPPAGDIPSVSPTALPPVYLLAKLYPRSDMKDSGYKPVIKLQTLVDPKDFISNQFGPRCINFSPHADKSRKTYIPQRPFPVNIVDDTQYSFPLASDQIVAAWAAFSMIIANTGGSETYSETVARVYFDAQQGKWVILEISRRSPDTAIEASQILTHLIHLASLTAENTNVHVRPVQLATFPELFVPHLRSAFTDFTKAYLHTPNTEGSVFSHYDSISTNLSMNESMTAGAYAAKNKKMETCAEIRSVNNFLKFVLLSCGLQSLHRNAPEKHSNASTLYLLDLCSGRGGDLMKFKHLNGIRVPALGQTSLGGVVCVDGSLISLGTAAARYCVTPGLSVNSTKKKPRERHQNHSACGIPTRFVHADCCSTDLQPTYKDFFNTIGKAPTPFFDLVSIQFAIHYAFRSEIELRRLLENITVCLRPGGTLVATFVDEQKIISKSYTESGSTLAWRSANDSCMITVQKNFFDATTENESLFGRSYCFHLGDVVDGEQEYLVDLQRFLTISSEYGLSECIVCESFENLFESAMSEGALVLPRTAESTASAVPECASIPSFAEIAHKFLKLEQFRKRESSNTDVSPVRKWRELPVEIREVCGLYKGIILRKSC